MPLGSIADAAFRPERLEAALVGRTSRAGWLDGVGAELEARFGPLARSAVEDWCRLRPRTDVEMVAVVRGVRRVARIALLTNAPTGIRADLAASGLDAEFDVVLCSADLGVAKPDHAAFVRAVAILGLEPGDCVVIDDEERNVRSARAAGFRAITHLTPGRTERRLAAMGLAIAAIAGEPASSRWDADRPSHG